jgi:hypothetical protein
VAGNDPDRKPTSGRVRHDSSGRAVWEWAVESGRHAIDSTSRLLKKLELTSLTLMGDEQKQWDKKVPGGNPAADDNVTSAGNGLPAFRSPRETDRLAQPQQGFDPYNTRTTGGDDTARSTASPRPAVAQEQAAKQPGFLMRLFGRGR